MYLDKLGTILGRPAVIKPLPLTLRYAPERLRGEAIKAASGVVLCVAALLVLSPAAAIAWPIGLVALLFLAYLIQQWRRRALRLELDSAGLAHDTGGSARRIAWARLDTFRLHFFPHRRRSPQGTLVLTLRGDSRMKLDSALVDFATLLLHAAAAARERGLTLDATTEANLAQLGL